MSEAKTDTAVPKYFLLKAMLLPVIVIPALVITFLVIRGDRAEQLYLRALDAAKRGDYAAACADFARAGELGHAESACNLALIYQSGVVKVENARELTEANFLLAALNGSARAEYELGKLAESNAEPDYKQAAMYYRSAALAGLPEAMVALGKLHEKGLGVNKSADLAKEFYGNAARSGCAAGAAELGLLYASGELGEVDLSAARKALLSAAAMDYPRAFTALGFICEQSNDMVYQAQAAEYYRQAAELNDPEGMVNYGDYLKRRGQIADALDLYLKAANEHNFHPAQHRAGLFYFSQSNPDYVLARKYFERAAVQGNAASWINLGIMAELGHGFKADFKRARECYSMAEKLGHSDAANHLRQLPPEPVGQ